MPPFKRSRSSSCDGMRLHLKSLFVSVFFFKEEESEGTRKEK
jgi:hypothetical protein